MRDGGWITGKSIMLELSFSIGQNKSLSDQGIHLTEYQVWKSKWDSVTRGIWNPSAVIALFAVLSDTLIEDDYSTALLKARRLTFDDALASLTAQAESLGIRTAEGPGQKDIFAELGSDLRKAAHTRDGFDWNPALQFGERTREQYAFMERLLTDRTLCELFWHLVDQYYFEFYKPWRSTQLESMEENEAYVISCLGSVASDSGTPDVSWLPSYHPLQYSRFLERDRGYSRPCIFFWISPYDLSGSMSIQTDYFVVSANPGAEKFSGAGDDVDNLSTRLKALADPTRIKILHLIRYFSLDNTQMARYLNIARPTVSIHTKILREAGLIQSYQEGRSTKHHIAYPAVSALLEDIDRYINLMNFDL